MRKDWENVYDWTDLLHFSAGRGIASWNEAHNILNHIALSVYELGHYEIYSHIDEEGKRWFENEYAEDSAIYKILDGFMTQENIEEMVLVR